MSCGDVVSDQRHRAGAVKIDCRVAGARQAQRPNQELRTATGGSQPDHACDHQAEFTGHAPRVVRRLQKHQRRAFRQVETLCAWNVTLCITTNAPGGGDGFGQRASKQPNDSCPLVISIFSTGFTFLASAALPTLQDRDPDCRCRCLGKLTGN